MTVNKVLQAVTAAAMTVMLVAAVLPLLNVAAPWVAWLYAAAALTVLVATAATPPAADSLRVRRLHRIAVGGALLYCLSAATVLLPRLSTTGAMAINGNEWVPLLLAGALVQLYTSWVTDRELRKAGRND